MVFFAGGGGGVFSQFTFYGGSSVEKYINTTTGILLYKHAFLATWLEWWTVVAS